MDSVIRSIGFSEKAVVEAKGTAGGLCMMWKSGCPIKVIDLNKNKITIKVFDSMCDWMLVVFYGPSYESKNKRVWEDLSALLESFHDPWVCFRDFNYIICENEKFGGARGSSSAINHLKELMFDYGAIDLGFSGSKFT